MGVIDVCVLMFTPPPHTPFREAKAGPRVSGEVLRIKEQADGHTVIPRLLSCQIQSLLPVRINHEVVAASLASYMFLLRFAPDKRGSSWCIVSDSPPPQSLETECQQHISPL